MTAAIRTTMNTVLNNVTRLRLHLFLMLLICMSAAISSCGPNKQELILEGRWEGKLTETDEDGDEMTYRIVMDFNYENDVLRLTFGYGVPTLGELAEMSVTGNWMASEDEITLFADKESITMRFNAQTHLAASMIGVSLDDFEDYCTTMFCSQLDVWNDIKVYSISEESLTIDFDGSRLKLHKIS